MPRYTPQSLPPRQNGTPRPEPSTSTQSAIVNAIALGRHVKQEQGMRGVRSYAAAMRAFLASHEIAELCQVFGISVHELTQYDSHTEAPVQPPPSQAAPQSSMNMDQMAQMMQMLSSMGGMGGGMGGQNGGMNPMMLTQLMNMMNSKK